MDDNNLLGRLDRVTAPPDFERSVLARVAERRASAAQTHRAKVFRFSLAGATAALLVGFVVLNVFVLRPSVSDDRAGAGVAAGLYDQARAVPVMETVNYGREVRSASREPGAVYILEQVSNTSNLPIKY
jgi:hypothetical protein